MTLWNLDHRKVQRNGPLIVRKAAASSRRRFKKGKLFVFTREKQAAISDGGQGRGDEKARERTFAACLASPRGYIKKHDKGGVSWGDRYSTFGRSRQRSKQLGAAKNKKRNGKPLTLHSKKELKRRRRSGPASRSSRTKASLMGETLKVPNLKCFR